jgi:hypothetical protein
VGGENENNRSSDGPSQYNDAWRLCPRRCCLFYKSVKSNEEKAAFTTNFQKTNLEREKAKLKPLDWCSEAYKFDKGWATENPQCAERVKRYEAGETAALEP